MMKHALILTPVLILLTGTGCGMAYAPNKAGTGNTYSVTSTSDQPLGSAATTTGTNAPYRIKFEGTGYSSHSVTISTGSTLKVRFVPGKQNQQNDSHFYNYSMLAVYVGVGTHLQPTEMLSNGYGGGTAMQSTVIDLAGTYSNRCTAGDTTCRQDVTIVVTQPNNDDDCLNHGYGYCPYTHVPSGHSWNGTLVVQTDDTSAI